MNAGKAARKGRNLTLSAMAATTVRLGKIEGLVLRDPEATAIVGQTAADAGNWGLGV
jgi:hypothetical protein